MASIRPVERGDLDEVVALVRAGLAATELDRDSGWNRDREFLERTLFDDPWTPETPSSLVAVDDAGRVIGTVGAQRRRLLFHGEERDAVTVSYLVVASEHRGGAAGALLIRTLLAGGQSLTFSDGSTPTVLRIWRLFGGQPDATRGTEYMLVLRTDRWMRGIASELGHRRRISRHIVPVDALPLHAVGRRLLTRAYPKADRPATPGLSSRAAAPAELAELEQRLDRGVSLRVAHDPEYLEARFAQLDSMPLGGEVVRRMVSRAGRPIGWFAYIARPLVSRVLAVYAVPEDVDAVFEALLEDATERGTAVLSGRSAPHLTASLLQRMAVLRYEGPPLIHTRDPELRAALASSGSLLEELEWLDCRFW